MFSHMFQRPRESRQREGKSVFPLLFLPAYPVCACVCKAAAGVCTRRVHVRIVCVCVVLVHSCPTSKCSSHAVCLSGHVSFQYLCGCVRGEL